MERKGGGALAKYWFSLDQPFTLNSHYKYYTTLRFSISRFASIYTLEHLTKLDLTHTSLPFFSLAISRYRPYQQRD